MNMMVTFRCNSGSFMITLDMYSIGLYIGEIGLDFYDLNMSYCHTVIPHAFDCHRFISWRQYIRLKVR